MKGRSTDSLYSRREFGTRAESCPEFVNIVYPFSPGTARYHVVDRNTLLTRWIVKVSTMNAHIYVLTEFNYVQRDIIIRMLTQMQEIKLINICSTNVVMCGTSCVALLHFDGLIMRTLLIAPLIII